MVSWRDGKTHYQSEEQSRLMGKIKISLADRLFSLYIRTRDKWTCRRCGTFHEPPTSALHCSHFWGRGNRGTRWEPDNCIALCYGCHQYFESNKHGPYRDMMLKILGEKRYKTLEIQARTPTKVDERLIAKVLKKLLTDMGVDT